MEEETLEKVFYFAKCRCCFQEGDLTDLWGEHLENGMEIVYGQLLTECFNLTRQEHIVEQICQLCMTRLQDAYAFKQAVLATEQLIYQAIKDELSETKSDIKMQTEFTIEIENEKKSASDYDKEQGSEAGDHDEGSQGHKDEKKEEYEEVSYLDSMEETDKSDKADEDYLEVDFLDEAGNEGESANLEYKRDSTKPNAGKKRQKVKGQYRAYTESDMRTAVELVLSGKLTRPEACGQFNIPAQSLGHRIRSRFKDGGVEDGSDPTDYRDKRDKFHSDIKTVLTFTNATPYKSKTGRYYCAYCASSERFYEDPVELRTHTRTIHAEERLQGVDMIMRPYFLNEVLKVDIDNFQCVVCCSAIDNWNAMFAHLSDVHDVELDDAYTRIIPYVLKEEGIECALCNEKYVSYHMLDSHMNAHYNNYICGECGDTFLAETRLKKHIENHNIGKFPCKECGRVFTLEKYRKKHVYNVHTTVPKIKCLYCKERFHSEYLRHLHVIKKHNSKVKIYQCEICMKTFDWRPYFLKHMRLTHNKKEKKHQCNLCDKSFMMKYQLKQHLEWHEGTANHVCAVCDKKFTSKQYLQKHYLVHLKTMNQ